MRSTARNTVFTLLAIAAGVGAVWLGVEQDAGTPRTAPIESDPAPPVPVAAPSASGSQAESLEPRESLVVREALAALERARNDLEAAEAELDRIELEVESMEAFVADIEARGEDPMEYADETMARFEPILAAYLDAEARLLAAAAQEEVAAAALAAAGLKSP